MANEYVTQDEMKNSLRLSNETFADDDIDVAIGAASRAIDAFKKTRFYLGESEPRDYTATAGKRSLKIDDLATVTSVELDSDGDGIYEESWTEGVEYRLAPYNAALDGQPYTHIELLDQVGVRFPRYAAGVRVTGEFGWPAVPPQVKQAATIYAHRLLRRARETPYATLTVVAGDAVASARLGRIDPDVAFLLEELPGTKGKFRSVQLS